LPAASGNLGIYVLAFGLAMVPLDNPIAQEVLAYPVAGQTSQQQRADENQCRQWSMQNTGFNPQQPPPAPQYASTLPAYSGGSGFGSGEVGQGGMVGDGARGAALGAIGGAIAGDAGEGAAYGAAAGAIFGAMRRNQRKQQEAQFQAQQQQQLQQQQQQALQGYEARRARYRDAYALCMSSRQYNVR